MAVARGTRIGPYEIVALLGAGGMGEVYRASDPRLGRDVAIKVLPEATRASSERGARFEREARLLASINHPNIATIHGLEDLAGSSAIVMELVDGPSLADLIARGPLGLVESARIASQIADGMRSAHARGIIHRDLKPSNVRIAPDGRVKILDLASAHAAVGAKDEALLWLERAIERGMINYPFLSGHDWYLNSIRGDARFGRVMERAKREWERLEV